VCSELNMGAKVWDMTAMYDGPTASTFPHPLLGWRLLGDNGANTTAHMDFAGTNVVVGMVGGAPSLPGQRPHCKNGGKLWWGAGNKV
jgi:hypothetical protein